MESKKVHLIGADMGLGAQIRATEAGPEACFHSGIFERLRKEGIAIREIEMLYPTKSAPLNRSLPIIHEFNMRLADAAYRTLQRGEFPLIAGGDHSIAIGTWNGVYKALQERNALPLGLLWIDAHMDSHTPETSPSGAWHGMPLAALLGHGPPMMAQLLQKEAILLPQNVALIGTRSFEEGEKRLLERLNVKIYYMQEVKQRGLAQVLPEAIGHILKGAKSFGVSIDLDVFDPKEAPGVGSPEVEGIHSSELLPLVALFRNDPHFAAFELAEYNPERDRKHLTLELVHKLLFEVLR